jgi:hypothetical protein
VDTERLSGERHLPHLLNSTGLWRKRGRRLQQLGPAFGGDDELEAWEQSADDHDERIERMFAHG